MVAPDDPDLRLLSDLNDNLRGIKIRENCEPEEGISTDANYKNIGKDTDDEDDEDESDYGTDVDDSVSIFPIFLRFLSFFSSVSFTFLFFLLCWSSKKKYVGSEVEREKTTTLAFIFKQGVIVAANQYTHVVSLSYYVNMYVSCM
ncbi:OLC1v1002432C1 [Oldenlandia corymbosa var. corymbosa]|uniref:OLC1v1002432C1 n=1 Tax=Oldenlandia corymbosa var. corymbosa TaxID=529605 RepID=A0AAV1DAG9_OLDCO|nr:OLC1v1002432C1 [Oldenlandia corymbosa var. corymbosa]